MNRLENSRDLDRLIEAMADKKVVMLGEASHGTHEYYTWRTEISKRLIEEHGFRFIAVEGDWPDCYKLNRFVKAYPDSPAEIREVLETFDRWPTWMWANWEVAAPGSWLREHNDGHDDDKKVGFYGLDVYSLWDSMEAMMDYLEKEDPEVLKYVQQAWRCFDPFGQDEQQYARHTLYNNRCRDEVVNLLKQVRERIHSDGDDDPEAALNTEQNAVIAVNAKEYYTAMTRFDNESWNIRDRHMMDTLNRLMKFHGPDAKGIIWEHNTHIGDARATDMEREGMVNIGQLAREEYGRSNVFLCGFGSYSGTVVAADRWGDPTRSMCNLPLLSNTQK
ncbi:MAG: erythromycin esterase family protein [Chryseobacterium sp.]|nr:MAG: erythromycin esterase family protein [Chryseobacterium sp.]